MHQSGWTYALVLGALGVIAFVMWLLGKLFPGKANTAAANALMHAEAFFNPAHEHVIEAREHEEKEEGESGDPPKAGT
jgi:hypothetical protein